VIGWRLHIIGSSATSRAASIGSCAGAPAVRVTTRAVFLSLEGPAVSSVGPPRKLMDRIGAQEGEVLSHPLITRSIGQARRRKRGLSRGAARFRRRDDQQRRNLLTLVARSKVARLKGEALKMVARRGKRTMTGGRPGREAWDLSLLKRKC
jgi:preprotein translocase subunit SecA